MKKINIQLLDGAYIIDKDKFDLNKALYMSGLIAGVCYDEEGFNHVLLEDKEKTLKRANFVISNCHHSVFDHIFISFNITNIPKIMAMILNNEKFYATSERSLRYTNINEESDITPLEQDLYCEWKKIFEDVINNKYGNVLSPKDIKKKSLENARYLVTTFIPTQMVYSTSLRQINYIASFMDKYIAEYNQNDFFQSRLAQSMKDFRSELDNIGVLHEGLMTNHKNRSLSLFSPNINIRREHFGSTYTTHYKGTFAQLAEAQRHRTIDYSMHFLENDKYYVPEILRSNKELTAKWLNDIAKVKDEYPQGQMVLINEEGKIEDFLLKCTERLCSHAQLEIMRQTEETRNIYYYELLRNGDYLANNFYEYTKGAPCTFPNYNCTHDCHFKEGKSLIRKI